MRVTLALLFMSLCSVSSNVVAQNTTLIRNAKCDEVVVRDKSHPMWKALDAQYSKIAEAVRKKDLYALFCALYAGLSSEDDGEIWTREKFFSYMRNAMPGVKETIHTSNTILRLAVCGEDEATATVLQQWYRVQMVAGKLRRMETNAVQDEHRVKAPDGWKLRLVDEIKGGAIFLDGKRVDPRKPLDAEAPAYDPYDRRPKQPIADSLFQLIVDKGLLTRSHCSQKGLEASILNFNKPMDYGY